jgi:VanZ family protein
MNISTRILFRACFAFTLLVITWLAVTPDPPAAADLGWDKGNHIFAFIVLAFLADFSFPSAGWINWLGLICYGVAIEGVQWSLDFRYFEWNDVLADLLGIALYLVVSPLNNRIQFLRELRAGE